MPKDPYETERAPEPPAIHGQRVAIRVHGSDQRFELGVHSLRVGRGSECDIVIDDPTVSRVHATLSRVTNGVFVEDHESRNGTSYLGQRIWRMVLAVGAQFKIGEVELSSEVLAEDDTPLYEHTEYGPLVGESIEMRRLFGLLARLEGSLTPVLLQGESGSGKEVVARAIHDHSSVASGPWATLNCGLPREIIASEIPGAFESAKGGTLFLDEIADLPGELQPVLLRALDGTPGPARVIAAGNRELAGEAEAGRFRQDLYYRLAVVQLAVPPLRHRVEDVERLARRFADEAGRELPDPVVAQLRSRAWPGNVRELRNAVQAYAALGTLPPATRSPAATLALALGELIDPRRPYAPQKQALVDRFTALYVEQVIAVAGNQKAAAAIAQLDRGYFGKLLKDAKKRGD